MWTRDRLAAYWEHVHLRRGLVPDAEIVCHAGAPPWLNAYVDRAQRRAFQAALRLCGSLEGAAVLDVGCGTGRWSRVLRDLGADVTGIDISADAISWNRERIPGVEFVVGDIVETDLSGERFDLAVTVTVIQHLPPAAQVAAARRLAQAIRPGGHLIALENIRDSGVHVFARTPAGWRRLFGEQGLRPRYLAGYEYDLPLRMVSATSRRARPRSRAKAAADATLDPSLAARLWRAGVVHPAVWLSSAIEPICVRTLSADMATHAAMVFTKPAA